MEHNDTSSAGGLDRLQDLFAAALERQGQERQAFLVEACGSDTQLKTQLEKLLAAYAANNDLLERSPAEGTVWPDECSSDVRQLPTRIGHYWIRRLIATGGMGTVYEAEQDEPRRTVALKVMRWSLASHEGRSRFRFESELLARLRHPGVAQVFEAGTHEDGAVSVPYFVMEYIPQARSIIQFADDEKLDLEQRLELFTQVCDAVHHGHQNSVIHRDLKPANILIDGDGHVKIIDFGVARCGQDEATRTLATATGQLIGTLQYMSPEQCAGNPHEVDTRSDVYSLGVVLYELVSGTLPYEVASLPLSDATRVVREAAPLRLSTVNACLRGDLETIVGKALEKDKQRRYPSAAGLANDIRRYLAGDAISARPASTAYRIRVFARRHKTLVGALATILLLLTGGVAVITSLYVQAENARRAAMISRDEANEVVAFLTSTLSSVNYEQGRGPDVTVREVLDEAAAKLENDQTLAERPLVLAALHTAIGRTYASFATYHPLAEQHLHTALELRQRELGDDHELVAECLDALGTALRWGGNSAREEGISLQREAVRIFKHRLGFLHPITLESMNGLGESLMQNNPQAAEPIFRQTLESWRQLPETDNPGFIRTLRLLALNRWWLEDIDEAEALFNEALALARKTCSPNDPQIAAILNQLANLCCDREDYVSAERSKRDALAIWEVVYGPKRLDPIHARAKLAQILLRQQRLDEAEQEIRKAIAQYRVVTTGRTGVRLNIARTRLGEILIAKGQFEQAAQELLPACEGLSKLEVHPSYVRYPIEQLVALYEAWGKPEEADRWRAKLAEQQTASKNPSDEFEHSEN